MSLRQLRNHFYLFSVAVFFIMPLLLLGCDSSGTGQGNEITVSVQPSEAGRVEKDSIGSQRVELEAIANEGWTFKEWTGDIQTSENPVVVKVDQNLEANAIYNKKPTNWTLIHSEGSAEFGEVVFFNASTGYIFGDDGLMLETQDGGESWTKNANLPSFGALVDVDFINESTGYIVVYDPNYSYGNQLYKTTDGGETWNEIRTNPPDEATLNTDPRTVHLYSKDVIFVGGSDGSNSEDAYNIYMTEDGGETWTGVQSGYLGNPITDIYFPTRDVGYAHHSPGNPSKDEARLFKTTNGGESWQEVREWGGVLGVTPIYFISEEKGFASRENDLIKTSDGGPDWEVVFDNIDVQSFDFISDSNGLATGWKKKIFRTTDSGGTWKKENTSNIDFPKNTILYDVSYVNQDVAYVVGYPGLILKYEI